MNRGPLLNSSLPCPVCGVSHCNERRVTLTLLPCVFARKYRGELRSVATRRGIKKTSNGSNRGGLEYKQEPPIPPLSGGEVARETEEKGRGLSERSEFRRPRRRLRRQTQKPDNRGGASWFVLLAAEKNEQTKCISCIRDYLWRGKKIKHSIPPAVPRSIAGCGARKYRGELRSVATRRGVKNTRSESNRGKPPLPLCRATI